MNLPSDLDGRGLRIALLWARFNETVTSRLRDGARRALAETGVVAITEAAVPGAFELPLAAKAFAASGRFDGVVALGCVIRGETDHYDHVCHGATAGLLQAGMDTGVPVAFGVLTVDSLEQALARAVPGSDKGEDCARTAVEMANLLKKIRQT